MPSGAWLGSILFLLSIATALATPCSPSFTALCFSGGRFEVHVTWTDFRGVDKLVAIAEEPAFGIHASE